MLRLLILPNYKFRAWIDIHYELNEGVRVFFAVSSLILSRVRLTDMHVRAREHKQEYMLVNFNFFLLRAPKGMLRYPSSNRKKPNHYYWYITLKREPFKYFLLFDSHADSCGFPFQRREHAFFGGGQKNLTIGRKSVMLHCTGFVVALPTYHK